MEKIDLSASEAEAKARIDAASARTLANAREFFVRECMREGIDPALGVSPSLLKTIGGKHE